MLPPALGRGRRRWHTRWGLQHMAALRRTQAGRPPQLQPRATPPHQPPCWTLPLRRASPSAARSSPRAWRALRRLPLWLFRPRGDALRQAKTQTWRLISAGLLAQRLRAIAGVDARAELRRCHGPVLYLAASDDRIVPHRCFEEISRERPSVTLKTIPGRHLAMYANPHPAAQAILEFIAAKTGP